MTYEDHFDLESWEEAFCYTDRNGEHLDNHASFFNHGFPNCFMVASNETGIKENYLIAGEAIMEGEELLWQYGAYALPLTCSAPMQLLGVDKLKIFFANGLEPIEEQLKNCSGQGLSKFSLFELQSVSEKIFYCLNTPLAALWLHVNKIIDIKLWTHPSLKDQSPNIAKVTEDWIAGHDPIFHFVHHQLRDFVLEFESTYQGDLQEAYQWILKHIGTASLFQIVKGMQHMKNENHPDVPEITFDHQHPCSDSGSIFSCEKYFKYAQSAIERKFSEGRLTYERAKLSILMQLEVLKADKTSFRFKGFYELVANHGFTWQVDDTTYTILPMEKK